METAKDREQAEFDPHSELATLEAMRDATEAAAWMPPTPVWQAPILATAFAGLTLINNGPDEWAIAGAIVGGVAAVVTFVDQAKRQRVSPRRIRKPLRAVAFYGFIVAVAFGVSVLWNRIEVPNRWGEAATTLVGAWLATTLVFSVGITITNRMRDRWTAAPR